MYRWLSIQLNSVSSAVCNHISIYEKADPLAKVTCRRDRPMYQGMSTEQTCAYHRKDSCLVHHCTYCCLLAALRLVCLWKCDCPGCVYHGNVYIWVIGLSTGYLGAIQNRPAQKQMLGMRVLEACVPAHLIRWAERWGIGDLQSHIEIRMPLCYWMWMHHICSGGFRHIYFTPSHHPQVFQI